jgi:Caspase domain
MAEFARNLAFIIGIDNYRNGISPLRTATNDATKLVEILREKHNYQVWVCLNELATLNNLQQLLEVTLPQQVTSDDRLLLYFAGHGIALNGDDDGPQGYLIPQDAVLGDTKTYLPMTRLQECLNQLPCRHFLGILDCCFAGAFRWSSTRDLLTTPEVIYQERYNRFITDPAWQVITSATSDQKALDVFSINSERGTIGNHSPFAVALFDALEGAADIYPPPENGKSGGDGVITATELYLYLRDRIETGTEGYNQRQAPGIWALRKHDKGEYIFLNPGHPLNLPPAPPLDESTNPYRGLLPYEEEHSDLFFGKNALVERLQQFVTKQSLTIILGASGVGKSSLVKAGLIPFLRRQSNEQWSFLRPIRPGDSPLQALSKDFTSSPNLTGSDLNAIINALVKDEPDTKLLLIIDQFEEIVTLCDREKREEFLLMLSRAIVQNPNQLRIVLTLRSNFESQLIDTALKRYWTAGRFIVPPMTRSELREAIEKPAEARVIFFEPHSLVEQIIDEVADMPGSLPLMSFVLNELYLKYLKRERSAINNGIIIDRSITQQDYEELGGVLGSLIQRVEQEYQTLLQQDRTYEQVFRNVMLRMLTTEGGEITRRRVRLSELEYPEPENHQVQRVIQSLVSARLIVIGQNAEGSSYAEPTHDALILGWSRLRKWIDAQRENLILQRRLAVEIEDWINNNRSEEWLWDRNPRIDVVRQVLKSNDNWLNALETEFVQRSIRKKEGIIGEVKNLWERFTGGNRQPREESQAVSDTIQQQINIPTLEVEVANNVTRNTVEQSESSQFNVQRNIYALLVGIDEYNDSSKVPTLQGCVNDVIDVENYLNERVADGYQLHLRKLINQKATRQAVIDAFQQHLCQAESNDVAIFYFGGHGSQEESPPEFKLPEQFQGLINTLVCWDSRSEGILDLNGLELAYLMMKVSEKNPHFVIILDVVHADFDAKALMQSIIAYKKNKDSVPYRIIDNEKIEDSVNLGSHILLTACRDFEMAKEGNYNEQARGAFTYFLFKILRQYNSKLTYQDLIKGVNALVRANYREQSPQMRAMYANDFGQPFLGGAISQSIPYFIVSYHKEYGWVIDGGTIHGVAVPANNDETTLLALFPFDSDATDIINPSRFIGEARVIEVLLSLSKIEINGIENLSIESLFKAVVTSQPNPSTRVYIEGDSVGVNFARQALQSSRFGRKSSIYICEAPVNNIADFRLLCRNGEYLITSSRNEQPLLPVISGYTQDNSVKIIQILEHIARWTNINKLSTLPTSSIKADDVKMEVIISGQEEIALLTPHLDLEYEEDENGELVPPTLYIKLSNNSDKDLFCNVLALNDRFGISAPFFNTRNTLRLRPGGIVEGEYINTVVPDELWEEGTTESQEIFKLIVSTEDFDVDSLEQEALDTNGYSRS